jgi:hypothetical protein
MMLIPTKAKGRTPAVCDACGGREQVSECSFPYSAGKHAHCQWYDLCVFCRRRAATLGQEYVSLTNDLGGLLSAFSQGSTRR